MGKLILSKTSLQEKKLLKEKNKADKVAVLI